VNCVAQLTFLSLNWRGVDARENNLPRLSDLKDTGRIAEDAMVVMFIHRPQVWAQLSGNAEETKDQYGNIIERDALIIIAKNRQGPTGQISMLFYPEQMRWTDHEDRVEIDPPPSLREMGALERRVKEKKV
jgi:replicative DNA helicase